MSTAYEPGAPTEQGIIPLCVPLLHGNEWQYVKECLDSSWVSSVGPYVERFEGMVANYVGRKYAVAVASGTVGLHLALLAAGVQADDEVLVSDLTFMASANAIRYCNAWPVLIDAEPDYWQIDAQKVADFLSKECIGQRDKLINRTTGRRVSAIVPVSILGHPVDIQAIADLARRYNLMVIDDLTESLGATYKGQMAGLLSDLAVVSFNGNKIITTGSGGMVLTDSEELAKKVKYLSTQAKDDPVEYIHNEIGFNYRLTSIQAALGCAQLEHLDNHIQAKRRIARTYEDSLRTMAGIAPMRQATWAESVYWMYTIRVDESSFAMGSRDLLKLLAENQIQSRPLWRPVHMQPPYQNCLSYYVEVAEDLYRDCLSLPSSVGLSQTDQERVISTIQRVHARV